MPIVDPIKLTGSLEAEIQDSKAKQREVPEKYRDKSIDDVIQMHMEAEKALSRSGQTVGEQRKVIDRFIELQLEDKSASSKAPPEPLTTDKLFEDPQKAIQDSIASSEVGKKVEQLDRQLAAMNVQSERARFESNFPDVKKTLSDPAFAEWVQSSQYRLRMAQAFDRYDFAAGEDLLRAWDEHSKYQEEMDKKDAAKERRNEALRNAKTEGNSAVGDITPKKIYSRVDISNLMIKARAGDKEARKQVDNPEFQSALRTAYMEGRVK